MKIATGFLILLPVALLNAAGVAFLAHPSRQIAPSARWFIVASLAQISSDGTPNRFPVLQPRRDAWARLPDRVLGYVFVRKSADQVIVLRAIHHPRFRIPVTYDKDRNVFRSVCWRIEFDLNGTELPRHQRMDDRMEQLPVKSVHDHVFVYYSQ